MRKNYSGRRGGPARARDAARPVNLQPHEARTLLAAAAYFTDAGKLTRSAWPKTATLDVSAVRRLTLSATALRSALPKTTRPAATQISLPTPDGGMARFRVTRTQLLSPSLAAANPNLGTYRGVASTTRR